MSGTAPTIRPWVPILKAERSGRRHCIQATTVPSGLRSRRYPQREQEPERVGGTKQAEKGKGTPVAGVNACAAAVDPRLPLRFRNPRADYPGSKGCGKQRGEAP